MRDYRGEGVEERWFRYHQLFAELLRARLQSGLPKEAVVAFHQRAASWYKQEEHGSQMMTR